MYSHFVTNLLETFTKFPGVGDNYENSVVNVVAFDVDLMSIEVVLGLINNVHIVDAGPKPI